MSAPPRLDRVTMLPLQAAYLARHMEATNKAVSITQDGSTLFVNTGKENFALNADGERINRPAPRWATGDDA